MPHEELASGHGLHRERTRGLRLDPAARARSRPRPPVQEETFALLSRALTMYLGGPPQRVEVPVGGVIRVGPGTPLQTVNHGDADLLVYAYGFPPEDEHAELLESAV